MSRSSLPEAGLGVQSPTRRAEQADTFVRYLRPNELADRWQISPRTLERWRWLGEGPRFLKVSGKVLYRLEDIEAYEAAHVRSRTDERAVPAVVEPFAPKRGKRRDPVIADAAARLTGKKRVANR
jgi:hypothetical protein